jgi:hypothetical protein
MTPDFYAGLTVGIFGTLGALAFIGIMWYVWYEH